jgi:hypothetical protein
VLLLWWLDGRAKKGWKGFPAKEKATELWH